MTFYEWIKQCLHLEATRTQPNADGMIQRVMKEIDAKRKTG